MIPMIDPFRPAGRTAEERVAALERYVARLSTELIYVLSHLDEDNFTSDARREIITHIKEAMQDGTT